MSWPAIELWLMEEVGGEVLLCGGEVVVVVEGSDWEGEQPIDAPSTANAKVGKRRFDRRTKKVRKYLHKLGLS